jgi:hypothetical protein
VDPKAAGFDGVVDPKLLMAKVCQLLDLAWLILPCEH